MHTPLCTRCHSDRRVAIYDSDMRRIPLCRDCAGGLPPVVEEQDLTAVAASGACWCHLARMGLQIVWCPHLNQPND